MQSKMQAVDHIKTISLSIVMIRFFPSGKEQSQSQKIFQKGWLSIG
jgi:hypothetical protein